MRVDTDRLRVKIKEQRMTQRSLSRAMSIDKSTFSRKMKSDALDFTIGEMHLIADVLNLSKQEAREIFLA